MADAELSFDIRKLNKFLEKLQSRTNTVVKKHQEYVDLIAPTVFRDVMDHFKKQTGPNGPWDDWSYYYAVHMEKIGKGGNKILQDSRHMAGAFHPNSDWKKEGNSLIFFNNAKTKTGFEYAAHHDEGRSSWKGNPRPFMWLSDEALDKIGKRTAKFMIGED